MQAPVVLQFFVCLFTLWFALSFVVLGVLCVAAVDVLAWLEDGAAAGAVHLAVVAAVVLRKGFRLTSRAVAP